MNTFIEWFIIGLATVWTIGVGVFIGLALAHYFL